MKGQGLSSNNNFVEQHKDQKREVKDSPNSKVTAETTTKSSRVTSASNHRSSSKQRSGGRRLFGRLFLWGIFGRTRTEKRTSFCSYDGARVSLSSHHSTQPPAVVYSGANEPERQQRETMPTENAAVLGNGKKERPKQNKLFRNLFFRVRKDKHRSKRGTHTRSSFCSYDGVEIRRQLEEEILETQDSDADLVDIEGEGEDTFNVNSNINSSLISDNNGRSNLSSSLNIHNANVIATRNNYYNESNRSKSESQLNVETFPKPSIATPAIGKKDLMPAADRFPSSSATRMESLLTSTSLGGLGGPPPTTRRMKVNGNLDEKFPLHGRSLLGTADDSHHHSPKETAATAAAKKTTPLSNFHSSDENEKILNEEDKRKEKAYFKVPNLDADVLPRGGVSFHTEAVGQVQYGIPPETIKDSLTLGLQVPTVYIVPIQRFCREMGPALGINLAEFEFPAYYNFFISQKRCQLVVDSKVAEDNIRRVFSETLLGPEEFRREYSPMPYSEEDFDQDFDREMIPDFEKELRHFRTMPNGSELTVETLLQFRQFDNREIDKKPIGVPPPYNEKDDDCWDGAIGGSTGAQRGDDLGALFTATMENRNNTIDNKKWSYAFAKNMAEVARIYPINATKSDIEKGTCKRVEIFKEKDGSEYVLHDIDDNNVIIGKAKFAGHVRVSSSMRIDSFFTNAEASKSTGFDHRMSIQSISSTGEAIGMHRKTKTFHPPSFGLTVLGNSHGFDPEGSTSGYVLWINGRGVLVDPPPYSSATLEREGIRQRTIVGVIITHCHADHDAGAFQKVLFGSSVAVITTPTIYKSFIRKYAALSNLSPALLRHSHRFKPAIIGRPLFFQGATFTFQYSLHAIPCVAFKAEWRGKSIVFTGDHLNNPPDLDRLEAQGVLSNGRADDLRQLPLQDCDLLMHEAGPPPIHTPLSVLLALPRNVKNRLYVVHTNKLPDDCELRIAPQGTDETLRLDAHLVNRRTNTTITDSEEYHDFIQNAHTRSIINPTRGFAGATLGSNRMGGIARFNASIVSTDAVTIPPVLISRPSSSTDAWFTLNLLNAVPFLSSLSYQSTMEVLEISRVHAFCVDEVVIPCYQRRSVLCVFWEGICIEREAESQYPSFFGMPRLATAHENQQEESQQQQESQRTRRSSKDQLRASFEHKCNEVTRRSSFTSVKKKIKLSIWHPGDWTGPRALQPDKRLSGETSRSSNHDVVALSSEGVKVIFIDFEALDKILKNGSALYRRYLSWRNKNVARRPSYVSVDGEEGKQPDLMRSQAVRNLNLEELIDCNSSLRKLTAVTKRHFESLAEGPHYFASNEKLWTSGSKVDKCYLIVEGTAYFLRRLQRAKSKYSTVAAFSKIGSLQPENDGIATTAKILGEAMKNEHALSQLEDDSSDDDAHDGDSSISSNSIHNDDDDDVNIDLAEGHHKKHNDGSDQSNNTHNFPARGGDRDDRSHISRGENSRTSRTSGLASMGASQDVSIGTNISPFSRSSLTSNTSFASIASSYYSMSKSFRRRSTRDKFANEVFGKIYNQKMSHDAGLVFSRGHFLGNISKMVEVLLTPMVEGDEENMEDEGSYNYGFGDKAEGDILKRETIGEMTIDEQGGGNNKMILHSSTLVAGKEGCVVITFSKENLIDFLNEYPGVLLSLLGTQAIV